MRPPVDRKLDGGDENNNGDGRQCAEYNDFYQQICRLPLLAQPAAVLARRRSWNESAGANLHGYTRCGGRVKYTD